MIGGQTQPFYGDCGELGGARSHPVPTRYRPGMDVHVNGHPHPLPSGSTIATLLESLGLARQACAVEVNKELVPRNQHPGRELAAGDRVEVVTLVGGG